MSDHIPALWAFEAVERERAEFLGLKFHPANCEIARSNPESWPLHHAWAAHIERQELRCGAHVPPTERSLLARACHMARLASRPCCRAHGTTCPDCRAADYESPRWVVRLRDLRDALRAWWRHG